MSSDSKESSDVKVLYIAGMGRSGSTLLGRLFGEPAEAAHVGELVYLWRRSFREKHVCGCGAPFLECPFWTEVFEQGFGGFANVDPDAFLETKRLLERTRALPRFFWPRKSLALQTRLDEYRATLSALYRAVQQTTGARVIVDGSKSEAYGYMLETVPGLDVRTAHLIRDSRAVAHSHQRRKADPSHAAPGHPAGTAFMTTSRPLRVAAAWNASALLLALRRPGRAGLRLRYEDFIADPETALRGLWELMDEPIPDLSFLADGTMHLRTNHTVAGNPDRFRPAVTLRPDQEWLRKMPPRDRRLVTALTWPLLLRYGYLSRRSPSAVSQPIPHPATTEPSPRVL